MLKTTAHVSDVALGPLVYAKKGRHTDIRPHLFSLLSPNVHRRISNRANFFLFDVLEYKHNHYNSYGVKGRK